MKMILKRSATILSLGFLFSSMMAAASTDIVTFVCRELLGRPTGTSIALNLCTNIDADIFVEYGLQPSVYSSQSQAQRLVGGQPFTIELKQLVPDSRYFYRVRFRSAGSSEFLSRTEHTFQTARPPGRPFVFAIEADPHMDTATSAPLLKRTFVNTVSSGADFLLDLGDTFMTDKLPLINQEEITKRNLLLRSCYDTACHSVPLMLVQGNHDGELGWFVNGTANNMAVWGANIRKAYYPNPIPGDFYTGDTTNNAFVGIRQNYFAWEWGDALFVVLDPYWYTTKKPGSTKNNWDWTLGRVQYDWFKRTLEQSHAGFKFVFAHQIIGGVDTEGRGGIEGVPYYEMGGLNSDGTNGFTTNRPGWPMPIHQLMVANHVSAFFHGHDHVYVKQDLDGIVYQEVPQPGYYNSNNPAKSYSNIGIAAQYGYTHGVVYASSGFLRVTVSDTAATVDYLRSYLPEHENAQQRTGDIAYSYSIKPTRPSEVGLERGAAPFDAVLDRNFPNPFNPSTTIRYRIPSSGFVTVGIYDMIGRQIAVPVHGIMSAGTHTFQWNAAGLPSGVYVCRLVYGGKVSTQSMVVIK